MKLAAEQKFNDDLWNKAEERYGTAKRIPKTGNAFGEGGSAWLGRQGHILPTVEHDDISNVLPDDNWIGAPGDEFMRATGAARVGHMSSSRKGDELYIEHHHPLTDNQQKVLLSHHKDYKRISIHNWDKGHNFRLNSPTHPELARALRGDKVIQKQFSLHNDLESPNSGKPKDESKWEEAKKRYPTVSEVPTSGTLRGSGGSGWIGRDGTILHAFHSNTHDDIRNLYDEEHQGNPIGQFMRDTGALRVGTYKHGTDRSEFYVEHYHPPTAEQAKVVHSHAKQYNKTSIGNLVTGKTSMMVKPKREEIARALRGDHVIQKQFSLIPRATIAGKPSYWSQTGGGIDEIARENTRPNPKMLKPLPHSKCECDTCMQIREDNHGARQMMNWRRPPYKGTGTYVSPEEEAWNRRNSNLIPRVGMESGYFLAWFSKW